MLFCSSSFFSVDTSFSNGTISFTSFSFELIWLKSSGFFRALNKYQHMRINKNRCIPILKKAGKYEGSENLKMFLTKAKKYKKELAQLVLEGNKLSKGSSVTGSNDYSQNETFSNYIKELPSFVRPFWKLPSYLIEKDLRCRVKVFISKDGRILNYKIFESSGDPEFDQRAIAAIKQVIKFPEPDKEIVLRVASGEVILGFPL